MMRSFRLIPTRIIVAAVPLLSRMTAVAAVPTSATARRGHAPSAIAVSAATARVAPSHVAAVPRFAVRLLARHLVAPWDAMNERTQDEI